MASMAPSGLKATPRNPPPAPGSGKPKRRLPVRASHTTAVPSSSPVTIRDPSGLYARSWIGDLAPTSESSRVPFFVSQTNASVAAGGEPADWAPEVEPAVTRREPSGLTAIAAVAGFLIASTTLYAARAR